MNNVWQDAITQYLNEPAPDPSVAPHGPPTAGAVTPSASAPASPPAEKLPTTGIDTTWMVVLAIVLVVAGGLALWLGNARRFRRG